jgi:hypothetical protein
MCCLVSHVVGLYNSLICALKKEYYELHVKNNSYNGCGLSHEVVVLEGRSI